MSRRSLPTVLLVAALLGSGCTADEYVAPRPDRASEAVSPGRAADTVALLEDALAASDGAAAAALAADADARSRLSAVARNAGALDLTDVSLRYLSETGRTVDGAWEGLVGVTWRIRGYDAASARLEVPMLFDDDGRRIAGIGGDGHPLPLWLAGPLTVRRTAAALVFGTALAEDVARYARRAGEASTEVRDALGGPGRFVVEVPSDDAALHRALGASPGEYSEIAAVTAPVDGSLAPGSPVHVFVNPAVLGGLDPLASQVVMTHEAVHAVTGAAYARQAPKWLVEGFADYIALREVDLPVTRTAAQVIEQVRRDGLPAGLPTGADFAASGTHLGAVYESAWLVAVTLAERGGADALIAFYRAVLDGTPVGEALRAQFGWNAADLTAAWRARLAEVAGLPA